MNHSLETSESHVSNVRQTNIEFLTDLMDFAKTGPMVQLFVLDAVGKHARRIVENEAEVLESMKDSFVRGESWVAAAKEIKEAFDARENPIGD